MKSINESLQRLESFVVRQLFSAVGALIYRKQKEIPKAKGDVQLLGKPTVADRITQMIVKRLLEPVLEAQFGADSYGYRPGKSAKDALGVAGQRCWKYNWVVDLDIRAFFDSVDHGLLMRAVRKHTTCAWVPMYIERWLKAPMQMSDGQIIERHRGPL